MNPVYDKLRSMDIPAGGPAWDRAHGSANLDELTERVIRRADNLREEWSAPHDEHRLRAHEGAYVRL
jgi:hypothetical protein